MLPYIKVMKALIIKKPWIDYILDGKKVWEIRSSNTKIRGQIALIQSGSSMIVGECNWIDCIALDENLYRKNQKLHCISDVNQMPYKKTYAWVIKDVIRYEKPKPYKHPNGAVIWVNL